MQRDPIKGARGLTGLRKRGLSSRVALALLVAAAGLTLAGCAGQVTESESSVRGGLELAQTFIQTLPGDAASELRLTQDNGDIEVVGTPGPDVTVELTKRAKGPDREAVERFLDATKVDVSVDGKRVTVSTKEAPSEPGLRLSRLRYIFRVPADRPIRLDLTGANANVTVTGVHATISAKVTNGSVRLSDLTGDVAIKGANTRIRMSNTNGALEISNINGPVELDDVTLHARAKVVTANAELTLRLKDLGVGQFDFATSNAPVRVFIPYGSGVRIQTATANGRIYDQLPMTWTDRTGLDDQNVLHLDGWLNAGGAQLAVTTTNSDITLAYR